MLFGRKVSFFWYTWDKSWDTLYYTVYQPYTISVYDLFDPSTQVSDSLSHCDSWKLTAEDCWRNFKLLRKPFSITIFQQLKLVVVLVGKFCHSLVQPTYLVLPRERQRSAFLNYNHQLVLITWLDICPKSVLKIQWTEGIKQWHSTRFQHLHKVDADNFNLTGEFNHR